MEKLTDSRRVYSAIRKLISWDCEEVWVIALNPNKSIRKIGMIFRGAIDQCPFHPREILRFVVLHQGSAFIVAHNHPAGDPEPSAADLRSTERLYAAAQLLGLEMVDHLVLVPQGYLSFVERGLFPRTSRS